MEPEDGASMSRWSREKLIEEFRAGSRVALARVITQVENQTDGFEDILREIHGSRAQTWRIGVTGPPGAGKSTTIERLAALFREEDSSVGILAVDPSSPFSGGALLGDRVRMSDLNLDSGVFIRSVATRGNAGGLTATTGEILHVLEAFGFDVLIVETVGVGQSELDVASQADSTVVILVPESGDGIQILKAGLLEIADILVVNKSDRPGADALSSDIREALEMRTKDEKWAVRLVETTASEGVGIGDLKEALEAHRDHLLSCGGLEAARRRRVREHVRQIARRRLEERLERTISEMDDYDELIDRVVTAQESPYRLAERLLEGLRETREQSG